MFKLGLQRQAQERLATQSGDLVRIVWWRTRSLECSHWGDDRLLQRLPDVRRLWKAGL